MDPLNDDLSNYYLKNRGSYSTVQKRDAVRLLKIKMVKVLDIPVYSKPSVTRASMVEYNRLDGIVRAIEKVINKSNK